MTTPAPVPAPASSAGPAVPRPAATLVVLRDSAQLRALSGALDGATQRLEPDSVKRRVRGEYSAGLRDRVGAVTVEILR